MTRPEVPAALRGAVAITIGSSRDAPSKAAAAEFAASWHGIVLAVVDWPEEAASWLRHARRFTRGGPDAWVVVADGLGWARMVDRLARSTGWDPARTHRLFLPRRRGLHLAG
ncbi:hypothetical protein [Amycolatopsis sp. CA-230715]|uniref:hypothetical protein n=1 Tax=Amycolatopsis sp. CA-230715 TaxID=2745196 RepID=UPI001C0266C1|nr:hypothetical protein [Amycolatopsis sp. CA-230715]QWF81531.1 hypothetical protein HUW46_04964 [Amycolatopsis sp. CA-230715]